MLGVHPSTAALVLPPAVQVQLDAVQHLYMRLVEDHRQLRHVQEARQHAHSRVRCLRASRHAEDDVRHQLVRIAPGFVADLCTHTRENETKGEQTQPQRCTA